MKKSIFFSAFALSLFFTASIVSAPSAQAAEPEAIYPVANVRVGQKAYGLTVFQGEKVEKFDLELLGVLHNYLGPKRDLVVARLTDARLEKAGVVAGMSGSPIYVEGKLLGALGYSLGNFGKEGICGITPIDAMRSVEHASLHASSSSAVSENGAPSRTSQSSGASQSQDIPQTTATFAATYDFKDIAQSNIEQRGTFSVTPLLTPLTVSGVESAIFHHFEERFKALGFVAAPGGAGGNASLSKTRKGQEPLVPGSAVAAQLVRGDLSIAATGTVTTVDKQRAVLAFGHPFMNLGHVKLPMARAQIITIVPSLMLSYKLSETLDEVGMLTEDRSSAIFGVLGEKSNMLPVEITLQDAQMRERKYRFEVVRDERLTPEMVQLVIANSLTREADSGTLSTIHLTGEIKLKDGQSVHLRSTLSARQEPNLPMLSTLSVLHPFTLLWRNDFGPPMVESIQIKATVQEGAAKRYRVEALIAPSKSVAPGENLTLLVGLKPDSAPLQYQKIAFDLPQDLPSGDYELLVSGASEANQAENHTAGPRWPTHPQSLIDALNEIRRDGDLHINLLGKGTTLRMGATVIAQAPFSLTSRVLPKEGDERVSKNAQFQAHEKRIPMNTFIQGGTSTILHVRAVQ